MNENSLNKDQNLTIVKQTSFISNTEQNISTNHTFKTIKKRIPWSEEEDKSIKSLVNKYGTSNWTFISNQMGQNRSGKQCRERWYNQLNPEMKKNNWTNEEENILFTKHMQLGNKWSDIASFLPGRTLNDIKNHFYSKLRKFIRKILKQINDENLFKINGIDGCKYNGEKIYKMIKQYEITYKNLTKDTIFEMIIATEKNPKGKIIFCNDNSNNIEFNTYNSNYINNLGNNYFFNDINEDNKINKDDNYNKAIINKNLFMNLNNYQKVNKEIKKKIIKENNIDKQLINNNNKNSKKKLKFKLEKKENKIKKRKNIELNSNKENINIKEIMCNRGNENKNKDNTNLIKDNCFSNENNSNNNKLVGHKRKKISYRKTNSLNNLLNNKIINTNNCSSLLLPEEIPSKQQLKEKNIKNKKIKNKKCSKKVLNDKENRNNDNNNNNKKNNNEIKFISKIENNEKNNFCFYSPFKITTPKTGKNIIFPNSDTKSNKSIKHEDFSFNKLNLINEYLDSSQMQRIFPGDMENLLLYPQKNKNIFISDLSFDNILKSRGSYLGSIKNDNTYRNFSIDGNIYNKMLIQNNNINKSINNMAIKSIDENNILDGKNEMNLNKKIDKPNINLDLINHQDFSNTFINGNIIGGNESQYNSIFNKNNPIYNSSPSSMKSIWK